MSNAREQIIETTARLLELQGYFGTGLNQIVAESGAPKGSLYHYFPAGKDAIAAEAIARAGHEVERRIRSHLSRPGPAAEVIPGFIHTIAYYVEESGCRGGGPIAAVTLETSALNDQLHAACNAAYASWHTAFCDRLLADGHIPERAARLATFVLAAIEGAIILSKAQRSADPLRLVADELALIL